MKVKHICKDNDSELTFIIEDGKIDEVWIKIEGEKTWTVIGFNDLNEGIEKAIAECIPKNESNCSDFDKKERPLQRPAAYHLIDIFKELKFGRPAEDQKFLDKCIKELI